MQIINKIKKYWLTIISIIVIIGLIYIIENTVYFILGLLGLILFIAGVRAYQFRKNILFILESIERVIWKKPLNKTEWKKGEMKNTKIKLVWGKK